MLLEISALSALGQGKLFGGLAAGGVIIAAGAFLQNEIYRTESEFVEHKTAESLGAPTAHDMTVEDFMEIEFPQESRAVLRELIGSMKEAGKRGDELFDGHDCELCGAIAAENILLFRRCLHQCLCVQCETGTDVL
jgi:hypothetical protein